MITTVRFCVPAGWSRPSSRRTRRSGTAGLHVADDVVQHRPVRLGGEREAAAGLGVVAALGVPEPVVGEDDVTGAGERAGDRPGRGEVPVLRRGGDAVDEHDRGRKRARRPVGEPLPVEHARAAGRVGHRQADRGRPSSCCRTTIRGAFEGPVTGRVKARATGESTSTSAVTHSSAARRRAPGRRERGRWAAARGPRGVNDTDDIKATPPDLNSARRSRSTASRGLPAERAGSIGARSWWSTTAAERGSPATPRPPQVGGLRSQPLPARLPRS